MDILFAEKVYHTLTGQMTKCGGVPEVEDAFAPGKPCEKRYALMLDAYERLCERLGVVDEDADVEIIINSLLQNEQELCLKMFHYGMLFGDKKWKCFLDRF